ncbi:unnamed protein product [Mytilus coruscus]|uniref:DED domain-containing protein n=1 Tax=Mytilus coruscus TaxID=42192 RepID=A0A6J8EIW2_MYTCO|nr:unnamed protein product [Mytilus coruscus]
MYSPFPFPILFILPLWHVCKNLPYDFAIPSKSDGRYQLESNFSITDLLCKTMSTGFNFNLVQILNAKASVAKDSLFKTSLELCQQRFRSTMTKLDTEFQLLLSKISDNLTSEDVKSLRFLLKAENKIPVQNLDAATSGEDIFHLMTKHGLLSKTKTDLLINFLKEKNLQPQANELEKFKTENEEELAQPVEGPCNIQDDMVVEHFMETTKLVELTSKMAMENFAVLSGLTGCGKTQLALTFACNFVKTM